MHWRSSLFSVVFVCLISATQKFKLEKNTLNTKKWGKSRFDEILEVWIFILDYFVASGFCLIPVSEGSIFLLLHNNAWQRNLKKRLLIPILYMFACLVFIHSKMWFSSKLRVYIKDWSLSRSSGVMVVGLIFPEIFVSPLTEFDQRMYSSDPRPDTGSLMQLESRRAVPQASQPP